LIFTELEKFVAETAGPKTWRAAVEQAGLGAHVYRPVASYPDAELERIVARLARVTRKPAAELIEAFGAKLAGSLLNTYASLLAPDWRTLDLIEHVGDTIHGVIQLRERGAQRPLLRGARVSPGEVELIYGSQRRLCALARGLARGVAHHNDEQLRVEERECMHSGAPVCRMRFQLVEAA
jgi:hypothetical protein